MGQQPHMTQAERWQQRADDLMALYQPLEAAMVAIHEAHPTSKHGSAHAVHEADAFQRCIDLVPNVAMHATMLADAPDAATAKALLGKWQPLTADIMKQTETKLYEHGASDGAVYMCWKVGEALQNIYDEAAKLAKPAPHITNADRAAAERLGQTAQRKV